MHGAEHYLIGSMNWMVKFLIVKMNSKIYAQSFLELDSIEMKKKGELIHEK